MCISRSSIRVSPTACPEAVADGHRLLFVVVTGPGSPGPKPEEVPVGRWSEFLEEWRARKAGSKHVQSDFSKAALDLSGRLGFGTTRLWDHVEEGQTAYKESLAREKRLPPSLHVSDRDRLRAGDPIPRAERRVEDFRNEASAERLTVDDILAAKADEPTDDPTDDPTNDAASEDQNPEENP